MHLSKLFIALILLVCLSGLSASAVPLPRIHTGEPVPTPADSTLPARYKIRTTLLAIPTLKDRFLSPFTYTGVHFGTNAGNLIKGAKSIRIRNFMTQFGVMTNEINESGIISIYLEFDYSYLRLLHESTDARLKLYAGGMYNALLYLKIHSGNVNNVLAHDLTTALNASGMLNYTFNFRNKTFTLSNQLSIPLVGFVSRPEYAWSTPYFMWEEDAKFSDHIKLTSFGNYFRLQNKMALDYTTVKVRRKTGKKRENTWRISYTWDYYQINRPNQTQLGSHMLGFGRIIQF